MDRPNGGKWMSRMSSNPVPTRDMGEGPSPAKSNGGRHRGNRGDNRRSNHTHLSNNSSDANRANHNAGGFPNKGGAVVDDNRVAFRGIRDSLDRGDGPGEQRFASLRDNFHQSTNGNCHPNPSSQQSHNGQNYRSHPGQQGEVIPPPPRSAQRAKHYQSTPNSASTARFGGEAFHPSVSGLQHYTHTTASHPTTQPCRWTSTVHSNNSTSSTTNSHATSPDVQAVHGRQSIPAPHDALHLGTGGGGVTRSTGGLNSSPSLPKGTSPTTSGIFAPFNPMGSTTPIIPLPPQYGNYHGNGSTSEFSIGGSPSHSAQQMLPLPPAMFIGGISAHSDSHSPTFTNAPPSGHTQGHTHVGHSGSTLRRIMGSEQTNQEDGTDPARFTVSASGMDRLSHGTGCSINPIILAPRSHEGTTSLWGVEPATGSRTLSTTTSHEFADLESLSAVFSTAPRIADQQPTTNHSSTDITQQLFSQLTGGDGDDEEKAVLGNGTTLRYIAPELSSSSPLQNLFSELTQPSPTEDMNDAFGTASSSTVWTSLTASRREDHVLVEDLQQLDAPLHRDPSAQNGCVLHALSKLRKQLSSTDTRAVPVGIDGTTPKHARLDHSNKSLGGSPAFLSHSGSLTKELSASSELPHPPVNGSVRGHRTVLEAPVVTLESFACIFREMSPAVARREQILEKRQLPHALASRPLWPPRTESEVTQLLKSCEATKLLRHLNILHFSRQHLKGVQELFDTWARNGIPAPDVGFGAYYFYVKEKSEKVLCMKHNGRGAKPGHGYGKCDFESRRPNSTCRYEHVCLFCRSRDHGWFEEGKCEGYQQLLAEIEDLGVTEKDIEEMLDAMERADTPPHDWKFTYIVPPLRLGGS